MTFLWMSVDGVTMPLSLFNELVNFLGMKTPFFHDFARFFLAQILIALVASAVGLILLVDIFRARTIQNSYYINTTQKLKKMIG